MLAPSVGPSRDLTIRPIAARDIEAVISVRLAAYEAAWGATGWDQYREELSQLSLDPPGTSCLVAEIDGRVIGTVRLLSLTAPASGGLGSEALEIRMLAVDPAHQRRGVARALLEAAAEVAAETGLTEMALQSDEDLTAAHRLYEAVGFSRDAAIDTVVEGGWSVLGFRIRVPLARTPRSSPGAFGRVRQ